MTRGELARAILKAREIRPTVPTNYDAARKALLNDAHSEDWSTPVAVLICDVNWIAIEKWAQRHKEGSGHKARYVSYHPDGRERRKRQTKK